MSALRPALVLCLLASASPAWADPSGHRWPLTACTGTCPAGQACVNQLCVPQFRVAASIGNTGGATINGGVPYSALPPIVLTSFAAWTSSHVSCATKWNSSSLGTFSSPSGLTMLTYMDDSNNVFFLESSDWAAAQPPTGTGVLALTTTTYTVNDNLIFDADMRLTNDVAWSTTQEANKYDLESVVLHEAGHFLGLNHTNSPSTPVMFPYVTPGQAKRTLTSTDEADVCTVYPLPGGQGTACTANGDCGSGLTCQRAAGASASICTATCSGSTTCPTGYTCQSAQSGAMACLPRVGAADLCKACQTGGDCSTSVCLRFDATGVTFCSMSCTSSAQCGSGYTCDQGASVCVPNAGVCTNQCTMSADCPTAYTCMGGSCVPRGATGDECTVSLVCRGCNVCTRESASASTAFCRGCCAGNGQGDQCNACPNVACDSTSTCVPLSGSSSSICLPGTSAPGTCQACNNGTCADGLSCVAGRCRLPCNTANPGTCQSCFQLSGQSPTCACTDELALAGEPCGLIGNTLAACGSGLACVGSPNTVCRTLCDVNTSNACATGQVCQLVNGQGVCLPGTEGSICAPCTNTGSCNNGGTCFNGRCYAPCNVNVGNACSTCIQTVAGGEGICGCSDQIAAENDACGTAPEVHACKTGTKCLNGVCRGVCNPMASTCPVGTDCTDIGTGLFYCTDSAPLGGGGGSTGGGGGRVGGGTGTTGGSGGTNTDLGCGCGASGGPVGVLAFGLVTLLRRRRSERVV